MAAGSPWDDFGVGILKSAWRRFGVLSGFVSVSPSYNTPDNHAVDAMIVMDLSISVRLRKIVAGTTDCARYSDGRRPSGEGLERTVESLGARHHQEHDSKGWWDTIFIERPLTHERLAILSPP